MIQGMTGFGSKDSAVARFGTICVETRSTNHKFLEAVLHLPEGLLGLEDKIKKEIERRIKRGRITCVVTVARKGTPQIYVDKILLDRYISTIKDVRRRYSLADSVKIDTLINLPGVLTVTEQKFAPNELWPGLKKVLNAALDDLIAMRRKDGQALGEYLRSAVEDLESSIAFVKARFKSAVKEKASLIANDAERAVFLKEADISEELQRLAFHAKSFRQKLSVSGAIGKELDFICQEMQREANTIGAKSCDVEISAKGVQIKTQIEKLREQVQNAE